MIRTEAPCEASVVPITMQVVDFPLPPFGFAATITGIVLPVSFVMYYGCGGAIPCAMHDEPEYAMAYVPVMRYGLQYGRNVRRQLP